MNDRESGEIQVRRLEASDATALGRLFEDCDVPEVVRYFDPFPLTAATARRLVKLRGRDCYWAAWRGREMIGFAMVRGWDTGDPEPAFGILLHPRSRGRASFALVHAALEELRARGEPILRARMHADNRASHALAESFGAVEVSRDRDRVIVEFRLGEQNGAES